MSTVMEADSVQGQVVGDHNVVTLNFYDASGARASRSTVAAPTVCPWPRPVELLPATVLDCVDREHELEAALAALRQAASLEIFGPRGIGKSTLLRVLAHDGRTVRPPDGVVFIAYQGEPPADMVQRLFEAFFDVPPGVTFSLTLMCRLLQAVRALVLVDDAEAGHGMLECFRNAAPRSSLVLTSVEPRLFGEGRALALAGLSPTDAIALIEQWVGRKLSAADRKGVAALCVMVSGNPLQLKQAVAACEQHGEAISAFAQRIGPQDSVEDESLRAIDARSAPILATLAAVAPASLSPMQMRAITGEGEVGALLRQLEGGGLVERTATGYRQIGRAPRDVSSMKSAATASVVDWAARTVPATPGSDDDEDRRRTLVVAIGLAADSGRDADTVRLARAVGPSLALHGQWGSWKLVLDQSLSASQRLGDRRSEAWSLHELGTRALALEDYGEAETYLRRALALRQASSDEAGAALTRGNLQVLRSLAPGSNRPPPDGLRAPRWVSVGAGGAAVVAAMLFAVLSLLGGAGDSPARTTPATAASTVATLGRPTAPQTSILRQPSTTGGTATTRRTSPSAPVVTLRPDATGSTVGTTAPPPVTVPVERLSVDLFDQPRVAVGAPPQIRTLRGTGFRPGMSVAAGEGVAITVRTVAADGRSADLLVTVGATAAVGGRDVVVHDEARTAGCVACMEVTAPPSISSATHSLEYAGSGRVEIIGTGFAPGVATVSFPGSSSMTIDRYQERGATSIRLIVQGDAPAGSPVLIDNGDGGTATRDMTKIVVPPSLAM